MSQKEVSLTLEIPVVGCQHRKFDNRIFKECEEFSVWDCELGIVPEPENPYDPHALKAYLRSTHVGYVARDSIDEVNDFIRALNVLGFKWADTIINLERYKMQGDRLQWFTLNVTLTTNVNYEQESALDSIYAF